MYVFDVLSKFVNESIEFLGKHKKSVCEPGFNILIDDMYIEVDMRISYWRLEDDGTVVFVINDNDELEFMNDYVKFYKLMGFIDICLENDLHSGPQETINEWNKTVCELQELADKYGLYDREADENDAWYDLYTLWPKMKDFFCEKYK